MEDTREPRAINTLDFVPKSRMTGNPVGSYVFAIRDGTPRVLEYKYNPESDVIGNIEALKAEIMDSALEPVKVLENCKAIRDMCEDPDSVPYKIVMFNGSEGPEFQANMLYHMLTEVAKREFFLAFDPQQNQVKFYYISNANCMAKYGMPDVENDAVVLFARDPKTGEQLPPLANRKDTGMQELNVWMSTAISDLDQTFTKRMVLTIMHEEQSALIMLKKGGKP